MVILASFLALFCFPQSSSNITSWVQTRGYALYIIQIAAYLLFSIFSEPSMTYHRIPDQTDQALDKQGNPSLLPAHTPTPKWLRKICLSLHVFLISIYIVLLGVYTHPPQLRLTSIVKVVTLVLVQFPQFLATVRVIILQVRSTSMLKICTVSC